MTGAGYLIVIPHHTNGNLYCKQIYTTYSDNQNYIRTLNNGTWTNWFPIIPTGTLIYRGSQIRETTTITGLGALNSWDIVNLVWRANVENETYSTVMFPKKTSDITYITAHFANGVYWANARVWGGTNNVLGVAIDSAKDNNWKPGIIQIIGYKF